MSSPSPTRKKKGGTTMLPRDIRNELKLAVALKGFSQMREGSGKKVLEQIIEMEKFFHGKQPTFPSQLKMLCNGSFGYRDFYESIHAVATSKESSDRDITSLILKPSLTLNKFQTYRAGIDINHLLLEKKNLTGNQLITGRTLLGLARKGAQNFWKANSFAEEKWDVKKGEPKESGNTIEDVVNYVRIQMYKSLQGGKLDIDEAEMESEQNFCLDTATNDDADDHETHGSETGGIEGGDNETGGIQAGDIEIEAESVTNSNVAEDDEEEIVVPDNYMFPGFMSFMVWGPFAEPNDRLSLFNTSDGKKGGGKSRAEKRKADKLVKDQNRKDDNSNQRGLTIDQKISYEAVLIQQKTHMQQQNESTMVGLIAHESAFSKRLDSVARMAALRCREYDADNIHWKKVDEMEVEHSAILKNLSTYTQMLQKKALTADRAGGGGLDDIVNPKVRTIENESNKKKKVH